MTQIIIKIHGCCIKNVVTTSTKDDYRSESYHSSNVQCTPCPENLGYSCFAARNLGLPVLDCTEEMSRRESYHYRVDLPVHSNVQCMHTMSRKYRLFLLRCAILGPPSLFWIGSKLLFSFFGAILFFLHSLSRETSFDS
jgi:hypothetical protein